MPFAFPPLPSPRAMLLALLQSVQAVAVAAPDHHALGDYLVRGATALILALQTWNIRTTISLRDEMRIVTQALFGRRGDNGIERTVEAHGVELVDHERRLGDTEGRLERIDPDARTGPMDRRRS